MLKPLLIGIIFILPALSFAAPIVRVQTEPEPNTKVSLEVSVTAPETPTDAEAAAKWARQELEKAQRENPGIKPEVVIAKGELSGDATLRALADEIAKKDVPVSTQNFDQKFVEENRSRFQDWFNRHYRITFTLIRGIANSTVTTWGLVLSSDIPLHAAIPVGLVAGSMSAGFQYFNETYQRWLLKSHSTVMRYARNFGAQIVYFSIAKTIAAFAGIHHEANFGGELKSVVLTAAYCTLAQGPWSLSIAENARLAAEKNPEHAVRIRVLRDFKTLAVSMVSTAISIAQLVGVPLADMAMIGMAVTGTGAYVRSLVKAKNWKAEQARAACENKVLL